VASCFAFLASDEAAWLTGAAVPIDGGLVAGLPSLEARLDHWQALSEVRSSKN
jgi:hypothetical protein